MAHRSYAGIEKGLLTGRLKATVVLAITPIVVVIILMLNAGQVQPGANSIDCLFLFGIGPSKIITPTKPRPMGLAARYPNNDQRRALTKASFVGDDCLLDLYATYNL